MWDRFKMANGKPLGGGLKTLATKLKMKHTNINSSYFVVKFGDQVCLFMFITNYYMYKQNYFDSTVYMTG